jgi:hypothetical protein
LIVLTRILLDHDIILPMFIQQVNHKLVPLDDSLYYPYLPLVVVKYINSVSDLQTFPPVLCLRSLWDPFELIARPLISKPHLNHEYVAIFDNKFFKSHLKLFNYNERLDAFSGPYSTAIGYHLI